MRLLLFLSLLFFFAHATSTRLVVGTFSSHYNALNAQKALQEYIESDANFHLFTNNNKLHTNVLTYGKYYITTLEPFNDKVMERFALNKLSEKYSGAFILNITTTIEAVNTKNTPAQQLASYKEPSLTEQIEEIYIQDPILADELPVEELEITTVPSKTTENIGSQKKKEDIVTASSQITEENTKEVNSIKENSVLGEFMYEIIALITILIASVAYFIIKKAKYKKEENEPLQTIEVDEFDEETTEESKTNVASASPQDELNTAKVEPVASKESSEPVALDEFGGKEEGDFGVVETLKAAPAQEMNVQGKSRRKKREVPPHGKISKQNFKEFAGMRILVAEDNLINQKVITGLLADTGINITIANDGKEALDILQKDSDFTLILMDAHMPRIDGFEATRKIRANPAYEHILVVALSGDTAADDIKKMQAAGMEEHLEKPLKMDSLYDVLYAYAEGSSEDNADDFIEVIMTNELHGDEGLSICGGDENFYREILNEFLTTYSNSGEKIHEFLSSNQMQQADKLLLDIVGITSNIGAKNLNSIAKDLKDALADTEEKSYLTLADEYEKHLHYLLRDIKAYNK